MKRLFYILPFIVLFGCMTERKMSRITNEYLEEHPDVLAKKCADKYPIKDSIYIVGPVIHDTLIKDSLIPVPITYNDDTLFAAFKSGYDIGFQDAARKCADKPVRIRVDTIKLRDAAYEQVLKDSINKYKELYFKEFGKNSQLKEDLSKAKRQKNIFLIILIVAGIGAVGAFYKKIIGFFGFLK